MKRRLPLLLLAIALTISVLGCGKMSMASYTNINKDGSGDFTFQLLYDEVIAAINKNGFIDSDKLIKQGFQVSRYMKNDNNVEEVKYKFNNLNDINKILGSSDYITIKSGKKAKLTSDRYTVNVNFNKSLAEEIGKSNVDNTKPTSEDIKTYIGSIMLTNQVNVPGKIKN